ncbi:MAG: hypothetical protein OIN85_09265 [Candidatus Methanoperedens sp.]|nr:hypothetical protein [Candidatus Methanoperedens sp.]
MKTIRNISIIMISILGIAILFANGLILPVSELTTISAATYQTTNSSTSSLGVFYYSWGGGNAEVSPTNTWRYWSDDGHNPPNTWASNYLPDYVPGFNPNKDLYSAKDTNVIKWQLGLMKKSGINFVISSWWGQNHYTDQALDIIFNKVMPDPSNPYPDAKFAIYYEKEGFANVSKSEIISDINYIKNKYMSSRYYYTIDGRPVVFVYNTAGGLYGETNIQEAQKWKEVRDETGIYLVLKVFADYKSYIGLSDSWHQYSPAMNYDIQGNYSAFVSPGFYKWNEQPRLARDNFVRFENDIKNLKDANVQFKLIETWNEWGEGTGIEPAQKINHDDINGFSELEPSYGTRYVDIIAKYFNPT